MADGTLNTIIRILRERDLPYDRDVLKSALADPDGQTAIENWVEEYLSPATLLTKDEAALYATLMKTGEAESISKQDLSIVQGVNDSEIQSAIEELKRSTAAIEKLSENLRLQQNAMSALVKDEKRRGQERSQTEMSQVRKWNAEKGHIDAAILELSQNLTDQITDIEQQMKGSETSINQTVDSILKSDDKLLLSLQKLANDLEPDQLITEDTITNIRELCARFIKHTVESIRTRLDRIYLDVLNGASNDHVNDLEIQDASELQQELESLYSEILPVAQMSTEQQYLEPALAAVATISGQGQERTVKAIKYIQSTLIFLVNRLETFLAHAEGRYHHNTTLQTILQTAKQELVSPTKPPPPPSTATKPNTLGRHRSSVTSKSPTLVRGTFHRRSSGTGDEEIEPEAQLARNIGLTLPAPSQDPATIIEAMEGILLERITRLDMHASSLQSTTEVSISAHLHDANIMLGLLMEELLAKSEWGRVKLVDPMLQEDVARLERDVEIVKSQLEKVDLAGLQGTNVKRDQIVERWSR